MLSLVEREIWLRSDAASASVARAFIADVATDLGFERSAIHDVCLGATEAVANAVLHGEPCDQGLINVSAYVEADALMVEIRDCGDFEATPTSDNGLEERGRGLPLMFAVMDQVEIDSAPGRTLVRMAKALPGG